jgi:hypothetical protein
MNQKRKRGRKPKTFDSMLKDFLKESDSNNKTISKRNKIKLEGKKDERKSRKVKGEAERE